MHLFRSGAFILQWTSILFFSLYYFFDNVVTYFYGYRSPMFGNGFFLNQLWALMHMAGGALTLTLGPFLFGAFDCTNFHSTAGKFYMLDILLIGISAGWIPQTYPHRKKANYLTALVG